MESSAISAERTTVLRPISNWYQAHFGCSQSSAQGDLAPRARDWLVLTCKHAIGSHSCSCSVVLVRIGQNWENSKRWIRLLAQRSLPVGPGAAPARAPPPKKAPPPSLLPSTASPAAACAPLSPHGARRQRAPAVAARHVGERAEHPRAGGRRERPPPWGGGRWPRAAALIPNAHCRRGCGGVSGDGGRRARVRGSMQSCAQIRGTDKVR